MLTNLSITAGCLCLFVIAGAAGGAQVTPQDPGSVLKTLRKSHPRLILTDDELISLRKTIASDPLAAEYLKKLTEHGTAILGEKPVEHVLIGPRLLDKSRKALDRITTLALLFRLDGDKKWAKRAIEEMRATAAFSDWNPPHFLDTAEMTAALGFGYDWLYSELTGEDRQVVRAAIVEKGLRPGILVYVQKRWWARSSTNWNNVCNGGMMLGALAIGDEEPEVAGEVLSHALVSLPLALTTYAPDGGWPEGPAYWGYATHYTLLAAFALRSALGTDFGIMKHPGLRQTGYFPNAVIGPTGLAFNFADCGVNIYPYPWLFALGRWYNDPVYAYLAREGGKSGGGWAFDLVWFDPRGSTKDMASVKPDARFKGIGVVTFRSSWSDHDAVFVGFKGGDNKAGHSHLDLGSFVMDADGVRWADDLGADDYDIPGYFGAQRFTYYRLVTAGHNTLTLDGKNQDPRAAAPITKYSSTRGQALAVADLTAAYGPAGAVSVRRGVVLRDGRRRVLVQDEVRVKEPLQVVWTMHTAAAIAIDSDGTLATLTRDGMTLQARILSPAGARFASEEVTLDPPQRPLKGERKLLVRLPEKITDARIAVLLSPGAAEQPPPKLIALDQWSGSR